MEVWMRSNSVCTESPVTVERMEGSSQSFFHRQPRDFYQTLY